jgi:hypothetical protein
MGESYWVIDVFADHPGQCFTCRYFLGRYNDEAVICDDSRSLEHCPSLPHLGCAFWEREAGSDDGR